MSLTNQSAAAGQARAEERLLRLEALCEERHSESERAKAEVVAANASALERSEQVWVEILQRPFPFFFFSFFYSFDDLIVVDPIIVVHRYPRQAHREFASSMEARHSAALAACQQQAASAVEVLRAEHALEAKEVRRSLLGWVGWSGCLVGRLVGRFRCAPFFSLATHAP